MLHKNMIYQNNKLTKISKNQIKNQHQKNKESEKKRAYRHENQIVAK